MEAHSLSMLISLATTARDAAAVQQARAQQQVDAARTQLNVLHEYARDYALRAQRQRVDGCDVMAEGNARAFGGRLDAAVAAQLQELQRREAQLAQAQAQWRELAQRVQRLELLAARRAETARQRAERHEQRHNDEVARLAAQRRATSNADW
jgi:flagellar export protein FliJ